MLSKTFAERRREAERFEPPACSASSIAGKQGRRTAAAGVCHRRWKTGRDGDRSCHVLADCSMLTPTLCFDDAVAVRRRRRVTVTHLLRRCFSEPIAADHGEFESPLQLSGTSLELEVRKPLPCELPTITSARTPCWSCLQPLSLPHTTAEGGKIVVAATNHDPAPMPPPAAVAVEENKGEEKIRHGRPLPYTADPYCYHSSDSS
nr:hypothetical protein Iba_chr06cCG12590 [Ipomoea batatas]